MKFTARIILLSMVACAASAMCAASAYGEGADIYGIKNVSACNTTLSAPAPAEKLVSLNVGGALQKVSYVYGERFDTAGLVLTAQYENGAQKDVTAQVTIPEINAGDTVITLSYSENGVTVTADVSGFTVAKKQLDISGIVWKADGLVYNGKEQSAALTGNVPEELDAALDGNTAVNAGKYTASAAFSLKAGLAESNYEIIGANPVTADWTIAKAPAPKVESQTITLNRTEAHTGVTFDVGALFPTDRGASTYGAELKGLIHIVDAELSDTGVLTFNTRKATAEVSETLSVTVTSDNYEDASVYINVMLTGKAVVEITGVTRQNSFYNGQPQKGYVGKPGGYNKGFDITYYQGETKLDKMPVNAGDYTVIIAVPESDYDYTGSLKIDFTIHKATIKIRAESKEIYRTSRMPKFSYTVSGLAAGEKLSVLPTVECNGDPSEEGDYAVTVSGAAVPANGNYEEKIVYIDGVLTVKGRHSYVSSPQRPPVSSHDYGDDDSSDNSSETKDKPEETPAPAASDWNSIVSMIISGERGSVISVEAPSASVPVSVTNALKGRDITLEIKINDRASWRLYGKDITTPIALNLAAEVGGNRIPTSKQNQILDDLSTLQVNLGGSGNFGMTAWLKTNIGLSGAGKFANLYYLNPLTDSFELVAVSKADSVGNVLLPFTHASDYVIAVDDISRLPGDADNSMVLDYSDVIAIIKDVVGTEAFDIKKRRYMDLNGDGVVDTKDAVLLFKTLSK